MTSENWRNRGYFQLRLELDPANLATAQQKGERVIGRFIQHYIKPNVLTSIRLIDVAIGEALAKGDYPRKLASVKLNGKLFKSVVSAVTIPADKPVAVSVAYGFPCRSSDPKRVRSNFQPHTTRPDLDNLTKSVLDRLTALGILADDSQVCNLMLEKYRMPEGASPFVTIVITPYQPSFPLFEVAE